MLGRCGRVGGAAALLALLGPIFGAKAHELGTIRTYADFSSAGSYRIEVFIDREHLPPGFAALPVRPVRPIRNLPPGDSPAERILAEVLNHSRVEFDARAVLPAAEWADRDPAAAELVLRLTGSVPPGAHAFTWSNSLRLGSYLLTISTEGEAAPVREWMEGGETSKPFPLAARVVPPTRGRIALQYLRLGYTHILPKGSDHILFVLGIFLLSRRWKPVLLQVTAFTVAHTITLALTLYGIVSLRPAIVEPLIALSIVYVAIENVFTSRLGPWRIALVFAFGLVHGMGFAGVLSELGLPRSEFLTALLSFNAGVELGQLTVILGAFLLIGLPFRDRPWYRARVAIPISIAIAAVGLFWAVQRVAGKLM
ncbi:MAG TPA: HupE/UreJ family protein [Thermoanaerobaculia bacterium]